MSEQNNDLELPAGFGAPSSGEVKFKRFRLKEQSPLMTLRPLPSMKGLAQKNADGIFKKVHYGWNGKGSDPTKVAYRPFLCVEERNKEGLITQECPACKLRGEYTKKQNDLKAQEEKIATDIRTLAKQKGVTDETKIAAKIDEKLKELKKEKSDVVQWLKDHGVDAKWEFYAINKAGELGIGEIPYTLKKDWAGKRKTLEGQNYPKSLTGGKEMAIKTNGRIGVFFNFTRDGKGFGTTYGVEVNKVPVGDDGAEMNDYHRISNEVLQQAAEVLPCLVQEVEGLRIPVEKVQALVDHSRSLNGGYDPDVVDTIMGKRGSQSAPKAAETVANSASDDEFDVPSAEVKAEAPAEVKVEPAQVNMADASDDDFDAIFKKKTE